MNNHQVIGLTSCFSSGIVHIICVLYVALHKECPILLLEGQRFSSNLPQHTCLEVSCNTEDIDYLV